MKRLSQKLSVNLVVFQDDNGRWIAQCVEYDIVASAPTLTKLLPAFEKTFIANICINQSLGREPMAGIPSSPAHIREMFEASKMTVKDLGADQERPIDIRDIRVAEAA